MDPYLGEIRMFAGNYAPVDWAFCNGQVLNIRDNDALFALIGNRYGGDGVSTFALPDLRGRVPVHQGTMTGGSTYTLASHSGTETVTLTPETLPRHTHTVHAQTAPGTTGNPANGTWAASTQAQYSSNAPTGTMSAGALTTEGNSQAHDNMMPYLTVSFIICLNGLWPSRE